MKALGKQLRKSPPEILDSLCQTKQSVSSLTTDGLITIRELHTEWTCGWIARLQTRECSYFFRSRVTRCKWWQDHSTWNCGDEEGISAGVMQATPSSAKPLKGLIAFSIWPPYAMLVSPDIFHGTHIDPWVGLLQRMHATLWVQYPPREEKIPQECCRRGFPTSAKALTRCPLEIPFKHQPTSPLVSWTQSVPTGMEVTKVGCFDEIRWGPQSTFSVNLACAWREQEERQITDSSGSGS